MQVICIMCRYKFKIKVTVSVIFYIIGGKFECFVRCIILGSKSSL